MNSADLEAKIRHWHSLGLARLERVELIKSNSENGDLEALLRYNDTLSNETALAQVGGLYPITDAGNGEAIAADWQHMVRYVFEWRAWIIFKGGKWAVDTTGHIRKLAVKTMRRLYIESAKNEDLKQREKQAQWYISSENDKRIVSALNFTISQHGISITADKLDNQPWLLNVKNGTIDLKTGTLREAKADDLLTQQIDVEYNPKARSEEWERFLKTIFVDNEELIDYVQRGIEYSLNGTQLERVMFFLFGLGRNGKSQFMAALRRVLGPYADEAKPELFMEKNLPGTGQMKDKPL